jgi:TRAP-type mannitol/chloroaromatic compound transport system substrate-binding protein
MKKGQRFIQGLMVLAISVMFVAAVPMQAKAEKTFKWQPSSWLSSGISWDTINDISRKVTQKTNGRLVMTPSSPGAIVPVPEQLEAVSMGIMKATFIWPGYFPGQLPVQPPIPLPNCATCMKNTKAARSCKS